MGASPKYLVVDPKALGWVICQGIALGLAQG